MGAPPSPILSALSGGTPGQPPFGSSPLTMPVPNQGHEVESLALVRNAITALKEALRGLEPGTPLFQRVNRAMEQLERDVPAGQLSPGLERQSLMKLFLSQRQQNPMLSALSAMHSPSSAPPPGAPPPSPAAAGIS